MDVIFAVEYRGKKHLILFLKDLKKISVCINIVMIIIYSLSSLHRDYVS